MTHFIEYCRVCHAVVSQCRCPAPDKEIRYGLCEKHKHDKSDDEPDAVLPYDIHINNMIFRKGVSLSVLVNSARRWHTKLLKIEKDLHDEKTSNGI